MDLTTTSAGDLSHSLKSWRLSPKRIGAKSYQGHCVVAQAVHVAYQQQSTTFGRTAGVFGLSKDGDGFVTGGGGFVDTVHRGVVTAVFRDDDGAEQTHELPAAVAAREGTVTRLDMIGGNVIAATNLSGKGRLLQLMDASSFIDVPSLSKGEIALGVIGVLLIINGVLGLKIDLLGWGLVLVIPASFKIYRTTKAKDERKSLNDYIAEILQ
jgi:hypothetical protein